MPPPTLEKRAKDKLKQSIREDRFGERLLITIVCFIALFLFLHFRESRIDVLEVETTAKSYIVAQVDFQFPDDEATLVLRQEAIQDIGEIYRINERLIKERRLEFENYLIHKRDWRTKVYRSTFEEMYNAADVVEESLRQSRLTDSRTYQKMQESSFDVSNYSEIGDIPEDKDVFLPSSFWKELRGKIISKYQFNEQAIDYVINYFKGMRWNLVKDYETQRFFRQLVEASIPERYTQVKAGQRVLERGEKVSPRHVAMLKAMKREISNQRNLWEFQTILSSLLFSLILVIVAALYLQYNHVAMVLSIQRLALYVTIVLITLILAKLVEYFLLNNTHHLIEMVRYPLFVPFAALLICVLLDKQLALFTTFFLTVILGITLAVDHSKFLFINLITGMATILFSKNMRKRKEVFTVCGMAWLSAIPVILAFKLSESKMLEFSLVADLISTFICMLAIAILVIAFLPLLESIFRVMTDITLMEYMDPSNDLLRRLSLEAPGTYQHSLVVGTLSEAAASAIGANGLFCRVSTLYHDIGKLFNPHYFTENQMGGFDIHQLLTPLESAQVIIAHVAEGEALAKKHSLPKPFIDIIREHHGTTLVFFFYNKQIEQMGGDVTAVNEKQFRYPGPKPRSKESAIIMISDSVEAASRSMEEPSEEAITQLVNRIVNEKADEGQFDHCQLTFEELGIVKRTIVKTLAVTRHLRVKYPERQPKHT